MASQIKIRSKIRSLLGASFLGEITLLKFPPATMHQRGRSFNNAKYAPSIFFLTHNRGNDFKKEKRDKLPRSISAECKIPGIDDYKQGICSSLSVFKYHSQVLYVRSLSQLANDRK